MNSTAWTAGVTLAACLAVSVVGCRESSPGVPVSGRVTYQGEPIASGTVTFFPASGRPLHAILSSDGEYAAQLLPGDYRVVVNVGAQLPEGWKEGDPVPPPTRMLPAEYTTRAASTLTATVGERQSEPIDFILN
jgi:hypothetical protein